MVPSLSGNVSRGSVSCGCPATASQPQPWRVPDPWLQSGADSGTKEPAEEGGRGARRGLGPEWNAKRAELVLERMSTGGRGGGDRVKPPMGHGSGDGSFLMLRPWNPKGGYTGWELCRDSGLESNHLFVGGQDHSTHSFRNQVIAFSRAGPFRDTWGPSPCSCSSPQATAECDSQLG